MIKQVLTVAIGGALGSVIRYLNNRIVAQYFPANLHLATLLVNIIGCFIMGVAYTYFLSKYQTSENLKLFVTVGFLGALTTWSTFSMETVIMINSGQLIKGFVYLLSTFILCFLAFYIGMKIVN